MVFLAYVHLALFLALSLFPGNSLVSSWCDHANFIALTVSNSSTFTPASLRTHSFVFFAVHETPQNLSQSFQLKVLVLTQFNCGFFVHSQPLPAKQTPADIMIH